MTTIDLASCLAAIPDRRRAEGKMHGQVGVVLFSIIAMLSGARSYRQIHTLIKRRLAGPRWLLTLALAFTALAFGRIVSDTSFDVSPRRFIATAVVAACFWIAFLVRLFWGRSTAPENGIDPRLVAVIPRRDVTFCQKVPSCRLMSIAA